MHLIDQIGDFQDAVDDTAKAVGIKGEPVLVRPELDRKTVVGLAVRRRIPVAAHQRKADGKSDGLLLSVEVGAKPIGELLRFCEFRERSINAPPLKFEKVMKALMWLGSPNPAKPHSCTKSSC